MAPLCVHEQVTEILEPEVSSVQGVAQNSGSRVADLGFKLNLPHTGCVTLTFLCLHFLMCKMGVKQDLVRIKWYNACTMLSTVQ